LKQVIAFNELESEERQMAETPIDEQTTDDSKADVKADTVPFFPNHWLKEVIAVYVVLILLIGLAILFPFPLDEKADPLRTPEDVKPEWYFLWVYQALKYFPRDMFIASGETIGVLLIFGVVVFLQFVWPILDNSPERHPARRPWGMGFAGVVLFLGLLLMLLGFLSGHAVEIGGKTYQFDLRGIPHRVQVTKQADAQVEPSQPGGLSEGR
jgi:quinol-cytochrome oxidoreductase complex cytochrome b subunit